MALPIRVAVLVAMFSLGAGRRSNVSQVLSDHEDEEGWSATDLGMPQGEPSPTSPALIQIEKDSRKKDLVADAGAPKLQELIHAIEAKLSNASYGGWHFQKYFGIGLRIFRRASAELPRKGQYTTPLLDLPPFAKDRYDVALTVVVDRCGASEDEVTPCTKGDCVQEHNLTLAATSGSLTTPRQKVQGACLGTIAKIPDAGSTDLFPTVDTRWYAGLGYSGDLKVVDALDFGRTAGDDMAEHSTSSLVNYKAKHGLGFRHHPSIIYPRGLFNKVQIDGALASLRFGLARRVACTRCHWYFVTRGEGHRLQIVGHLPNVSIAFKEVYALIYLNV